MHHDTETHMKDSKRIHFIGNDNELIFKGGKFNHRGPYYTFVGIRSHSKGLHKERTREYCGCLW